MQSGQLLEKKAHTKRGAGLATALRDHQDSIAKLAAAYPFAKPDTDKLDTQVNRMIEQARRAEDETATDDDFIRTFILTRCGGGRIEKWIRELPEAGDDGTPIHDNIRAKNKFRAKGWRT